MHKLYSEPCKICGSKMNYLIENEGRKSLFCETCNHFEDIYASEELKQKWANEEKIKKQAEIKAEIEKNKTIPKCPTCSSTNIQKIGAGERLMSVAMLGLYSNKINKSFKCKNCGYTW